MNHLIDTIITDHGKLAYEIAGEGHLAMFGALHTGDLETVAALQIRLWIDGAFRSPEEVNPSVREAAQRMNRIAVWNGTWVMDMQPVNPLDPPAVGRLTEVKVPTLVMAGALDHPEILRAADMMTAEIQGAKRVIVPNAAHLPTMEAPDLCNAALLDVLRSAV